MISMKAKQTSNLTTNRSILQQCGFRHKSVMQIYLWYIVVCFFITRRRNKVLASMQSRHLNSQTTNRISTVSLFTYTSQWDVLQYAIQQLNDRSPKMAARWSVLPTVNTFFHTTRGYRHGVALRITKGNFGGKVYRKKQRSHSSKLYKHGEHRNTEISGDSAILIKTNLYILWPSDTIWRRMSGPALGEVMICRLMEPNHYLSQCRAIIICVLWHAPRVELPRFAHKYNQQHGFEDYTFYVSISHRVQ